jgi:sodium pump decarboxylase gamma subunit
MVACLASVSACGNSTGVKESKFNSDTIYSVTDSYMAAINELASQGKSIEDVKAMLKQYNMTVEDYYGMNEEVLGSAIDNYALALEDLGVYGGIDGVTYTETEEALTIDAVIKGTSSAPDGSIRTATVEIEVDPATGKVESILTNVNYTTKELMTNAALNTLLGMGTVFAVLIILMFIISLFKVVNNLQNKSTEKKTEKTEKTDSVDKAVAQIELNEQAQDDTELIAVIAAAIAASEGAASADGYVVRSIRRRY